jgi:site-specific recombinase XerD
MTKNEFINEYEKVLLIRRYSIRTNETYLSCLRGFLNWCEQKDVFPPEITKPQLTDYLATTKSASLLRQQIGTISSFYKYVIGIPYICAGIPYPKKHQTLPEFFTPNELLSVFNAIINPKQRLILKIQYALALRVHEVVKIKWLDFVQKYNPNNKANVYDLKITGKGNVTEFLPVPTETIIEIIAVLGNKFGLNEYLFKGQFKDHYSERSVQEVIGRAMLNCGITKKGSTHLVRHSRATHLIQNGASLRHVQKLLRHKKSTTTEIYTHLNNDDLRSAFEQSDIKIQQGINYQKQLT